MDRKLGVGLERIIVLCSLALLVVLGGPAVGLMVVHHHQSVATAHRIERLQAEKVAADWKASMAKAVAEKRAEDKRVALAARRQVARDKAAAKAAAERKIAARETAARRAARAAKVASEQRRAAAAAAAAARAVVPTLAQTDAPSQETSAGSQVTATRVISGDMTEPDINGALVTRVGGYPGQPLSTLGMGRLNHLGRLLKSLPHGNTYPCPQGAGGGYEDIASGGQVVIEDGAGVVLATTVLTGGRLNMHGCTFTFRAQVPDAPFYRVTVTHRGAMT